VWGEVLNAKGENLLLYHQGSLRVSGRLVGIADHKTAPWGERIIVDRRAGLLASSPDETVTRQEVDPYELKKIKKKKINKFQLLVIKNILLTRGKSKLV
jgi:hypothetical protein